MKSIFTLILGVLLSPMVFAQLNFSDSYFQQFEKEVAIMNSFDDHNFVNTFEIPSFEDDVVTVEYEALSTPMNEVSFVKKMAALTVGIALIESQFSWCLGGSYYHMLKRWKRTALYGALGFLYTGLSDDGLSFNVVDFQLQMLMFSALKSLSEIRLVYGLSFGYGLGAEKFDDFKYDISRFTVAAVVGLQLLMSPVWSLLLQTNLFAYQSLTQKPESGGEFTTNTTGFFFNKNQLLSLSVLFYLGRKRANAN